MKVIAVNKIWHGSYEWLPGAEFEYEDGADLNAQLALGNVKPAGDEPEVKPKEEPPWQGY